MPASERVRDLHVRIAASIIAKGAEKSAELPECVGRCCIVVAHVGGIDQSICSEARSITLLGDPLIHPCLSTVSGDGAFPIDEEVLRITAAIIPAHSHRAAVVHRNSREILVGAIHRRGPFVVYYLDGRRPARTSIGRAAD